MKKLVVLTALILLSGLTFGQTFQKGNLVGFHVGTVNLDPDVTFNQWKEFVLETYLPAFNKEFEGEIQVFIAKGDRGDEINCISQIIIIKSVEIRDKYFTESGGTSELYKEKWAKLKSINDEFQKLGIFSREHYTDWVIQ